jgi:Ras-related C3 botulinum toxin substrate 1
MNLRMLEQQDIKCVLVGDKGAGKTSILMTHHTGIYPVDYIPEVYDMHNEVITVDGVPITLGMWDTAGQSEYDRQVVNLSFT